MNLRDAQILNARKRLDRNGQSHYYCNLVTQVHVNCEHGNSLLSTEEAVGKPKPKKPRKPRAAKPKVASREEQHARYIDCGPGAWDDRD